MSLFQHYKDSWNETNGLNEELPISYQDCFTMLGDNTQLKVKYDCIAFACTTFGVGFNGSLDMIS